MFHLGHCLKDFLLLQLLLSVKNLTSGRDYIRTGGKGSLHIYLEQNNFKSIAMHDLEEIQFLEFMGGSNSTMPTQII